MPTKSQNVFKPFRGRRGTVRRKYLITFLGKFLGVDISDLLAKWEKWFLDIERCEGTTSAVLRTKSVYNYALRHSCGVKTDPIPYLRSDSKGVPVKLKPYLEVMSQGPDSRRAVLTVLQLYKLVTIKPPYTLSSITDPYSGQEDPEWMSSFLTVCEKVFPPNQLQERIAQLKTGYHITGSNGPNGPAIGTAFVDREGIRNTNIEASVRELCSLTKFNYMMSLLDQTGDPCESVSKRKRSKSHSRIRIKYEPGGKARPFAIIDWFSQSSLKSIHSFTMDWLKRIEEDSSSEHSRAAKAVCEWTKDESTPIWSYDLTSATDRFPVFLQRIVMKHMFGQEISDAWYNVIANRTFTGPNDEEVSFATGQALGALSSWSVFSITHHLMVQTAAFDLRKQKFSWFKDYRMIGDDIVIRKDSLVSRRYKEILDSLDVKISLNKSIIPEQCSGGNAAEIAKRIFCNGIEVTPVPPAAIFEGLENPIGFKNLIENSWLRGYKSAGSPYPVQSLNLKKIEWASLTFPFRNRTPQFLGVSALFQDGNIRDYFPAGLDPGWFIWEATPDEIILKASRRFLFKKVDDAVRESTRIQQSVLLARYSKSEREDLPQGGDWQPGSFECHPDILTEVFSELQEILMLNQQRLWSENILQGECIDLYSFIGQLHKYLEPRIFLVGRDKVIDEKRKTLVFMSSLVKYVSRIVVNNLESELDQEPEVESFPILDDLDFFPLDFE